jgi:hypothetical protein
LFSGISSTVFAEGTIGIFSLNTEITTTESVFVTGFVSVESFYNPVNLEVYDPNGDLVFSPTINFNDDGQFSWLFHPPLGEYTITGTYEIIASHEDVYSTDTVHFTVIESNENSLHVLNQNNKDVSIVKSGGFLNSLQPTKVSSNIKEQGITVKTSDSQPGENKNPEIVEFLESNELSYVIPITIALLAGIVVTWMRVTYDKQDSKKKQFDF